MSMDAMIEAAVQRYMADALEASSVLTEENARDYAKSVFQEAVGNPETWCTLGQAFKAAVENAMAPTIRNLRGRGAITEVTGEKTGATEKWFLLVTDEWRTGRERANALARSADVADRKFVGPFDTERELTDWAQQHARHGTMCRIEAP